MNDKDRALQPKGYELVNFCEFDKFAEQSYCAVHGVDKSLNLGDVTKVDEHNLKPFNMICGGSPCFPAGTLVLCKDGYKKIEDIRAGDYVLTHTNTFQKVLRVGGNSNKELMQISAQGILPITATPNHPFYVRHKIDKTNYSEPEKKQLNQLELGDYIGIPILQASENPMEFTEEECWILGRYIADGYLKGKRISLAIGKDKLKDLVNITTKEYRLYKSTPSCYVCVIKDSKLFDFIEKHIKKYSLYKNIPMEILNLPNDLLKIFLEGYFSGDGCRINTHIQATTVSIELAVGLCMAVQKVYRVGCRIYYEKKPKIHVIEGRTVNQHDTYMIRFVPQKTKRRFYEVIDDTIWYPIRKIDKLGRKEDVYNLEVENDHTYTAYNCLVSNCQDFSAAGKQKGSKWECKDCKYEYNPLTVHYSVRHQCPNCGSENLDKTRSSLLVEWLRIIRANKPKWGIYENVKNIVGNKFQDTFNMFINELHEYGYNTYYKVLNSKDFGIPQNRERVFLIIILKEYDNGQFKFPEGFNGGKCLKDILEDEVEEKYYVDTPRAKELIDELINSGKLDGYAPDTAKAEGERSAPKSIVYDDYNSRVRQDQTTIGTLTTNIGSKTIRNGYKIIEAVAPHTECAEETIKEE